MPLPRQLAGGALPPFTAKGQDAESLFQKRHLERMIAQDPKIKRVALVYFATWCHPCALGALKLKTSKEALRRNGVMTVFVNVGETNMAEVRRWIREYGDLGFPLIMDTKSQMVGSYGLLDPSGRDTQTISQFVPTLMGAPHVPAPDVTIRCGAPGSFL